MKTPLVTCVPLLATLFSCRSTATSVPLLATLFSCSSTEAFTQPLTSKRLVGKNVSRGRTPILFSTATRALPEGISKTTTVDGNGRLIRVGDIISVKYFCTSGGSNVAFSRSDRQRVVAGDGTMIRGWDMAIRTMREGERASIHISDPQFAYGHLGVPPFVSSNAKIDIDVEVISVEENVGLTASGSDIAGLDGMGMDGPAIRPRTPGAIAAAYERKMREKAINAPEEKHGIEGFVDWIKGSYFFGLFEGETGQEAPWYLKPNITFPLAFLVIGAAFWASLAGGAISERGMPSTDELDEIIISSQLIHNSIVVALIMIQI